MGKERVLKQKSLLFKMVIIAVLCWTSIMTILFLWSVHKEKNEIYKLAKQQLKAFFQEIVTTRSWNAKHGGVYVPVTPQTQPNPYLKDPNRDLVTENGLKLTKINPAFMTRQIGEIAAQRNMIVFHITSVKPIRPGNSPDQWESIALDTFLKGSGDILELREDGSRKKVFRYMAPLWVEKSCLKCHAGQGYQEGDLRGGISVTMDAAPMLSSQKEVLHSVCIAYGFIWLIGLLGLFGGHHLLRRQEKERYKIINDLEDTKIALFDERDKLKAALDEVVTLSGLLPICSNCKKIRDDKGYWNRLETYIGEHSKAEFTHSICPDCVKKLYPDLDIFNE